MQVRGGDLTYATQLFQFPGGVENLCRLPHNLFQTICNHIHSSQGQDRISMISLIKFLFQPVALLDGLIFCPLRSRWGKYLVWIFYSKISSFKEMEPSYEPIVELDHHLMLIFWWNILVGSAIPQLFETGLNIKANASKENDVVSKQPFQVPMEMDINQRELRRYTWLVESDGIKNVFTWICLATVTEIIYEEISMKKNPIMCKKGGLYRKGNEIFFDLHCGKKLEGEIQLQKADKSPNPKLVNNTCKFFLIAQIEIVLSGQQRQECLSLSIEDIFIMCFISGYSIGGGMWMHLTALNIHSNIFILFYSFILSNLIQLTTFDLRKLEFLFLLSRFRLKTLKMQSMESLVSKICNGYMFELNFICTCFTHLLGNISAYSHVSNFNCFFPGGLKRKGDIIQYIDCRREVPVEQILSVLISRRLGWYPTDKALVKALERRKWGRGITYLH
ncbi:hypothetical protein VP01_3154g2 [Puccinia sorghi]|uniref:Uncharacterized protein n=1 Tax=Puccinia sorghi TaxID=27349 RepID=A0A0L6V0Q5_9BASI|nr:hypothetical protein VP01_3154g2 [Puccinia sorghi]